MTKVDNVNGQAAKRRTQNKAEAKQRRRFPTVVSLALRFLIIAVRKMSTSLPGTSSY